jgi:hypothetical protein
MPLDRNVTETQNAHILATVNLGTLVFILSYAFKITKFTCRKDFLLWMSRIKRVIYPAGSNDWAVMGLDGNKETQQEFETEYLLIYAVYIRKLR